LLVDKHFDVFVDKNSIETGEEWHSKIIAELCECDAVVILLSQATLSSDWVKQEAAFSAIRRFGDPFLKLVVMIIDDQVTEEKIKDCQYLGSVVKLHDVQFMNPELGAQGIVEELEALANERETHFGTLVSSMSALLKDVPPNMLRQWIDSIGQNDVDLPWQPKLSHKLAFSIIRDENKVLEAFHAFIQRAKVVLDRSKKAYLFRLIEHLWVNAQAAKHLYSLHQNNLPVSINGFNHGNFTAKSYAERAWETITCHVIEVGDCRTYQEIIELIFSKLTKDSTSAHFSKIILQDIENSNTPILVTFSAPESENSEPINLPDEDLLQKIKEKFPTAGFFIPTGCNEIEFREDIYPIEPSLDIEYEERNAVAHYKITQLISNN